MFKETNTTSTNPVKETYEQKIKRYILRTLMGVVLLTIALVAFFGSYFIVDAGEKGVVRRFGETIRLAEPGLGFKIPIIDSVIIVPVREITYNYGSKTSNGKISSSLSAYTKDQQGVNMIVSVTFSVSDPIKLYNTYRSIDSMVNQVMSQRVSEQVEITFGKYNVIDSITHRGGDF